MTNTPAPGQLEITKTTTSTPSKAGDTVTFSFDVHNPGPVTVSAITIHDTAPGFTGAGAPIDLTGCTSAAAGLTPTPDGLAVGQDLVCTATYVVTQSDLVNGSLSNSAVAVGSGTDGTIASNQSTARISSHTGLAYTGVPSELYLIVATLLIGLGGLFVLAGRRRPSRRAA